MQASSLVRGVRRSLPSVTRQRQVADGPSLRSLLCSSHWCIACIGASRLGRGTARPPKRHRISPLVAPGWLHLLPATYLTYRHTGSPMYIIGPPCLLASQVQSTYHDGCLRFKPVQASSSNACSCPQSQSTGTSLSGLSAAVALDLDVSASFGTLIATQIWGQGGLH